MIVVIMVEVLRLEGIMVMTYDQNPHTHMINYNKHLCVLVQEIEVKKVIFVMIFLNVFGHDIIFRQDHRTLNVGNGSVNPQLQTIQLTRNKRRRTSRAGFVWCIISGYDFTHKAHIVQCFGVLGPGFCL